MLFICTGNPHTRFREHYFLYTHTRISADLTATKNYYRMWTFTHLHHNHNNLSRLVVQSDTSISTFENDIEDDTQLSQVETVNRPIYPKYKIITERSSVAHQHAAYPPMYLRTAFIRAGRAWSVRSQLVLLFRSRVSASSLVRVRSV